MNTSGKLKNWYHVTPSRFSIFVYNFLIESKRDHFWLHLQSLKLYNGVHAVLSLFSLKHLNAISENQKCHAVTFSEYCKFFLIFANNVGKNVNNNSCEFMRLIQFFLHHNQFFLSNHG